MNKERYPWDIGDGSPKNQAAILARANTSEAEISGTSPVGMYPLGVSQPFGLMDVAGNIWAWTDSWCDESKQDRVLRGGSWYEDLVHARCTARDLEHGPANSGSDIGLRLVSSIGSGS